MLASPAFRQAAHHAIFAEKMGPLLENAEQIIADSSKPAPTGATMKERIALGDSRKAAAEMAPYLRELLYPED